MDIKFIKPHSKTEWVFEITDEETILSPIKKQLILDDAVSFAGFKKNHPLLNGSKVTVKAKNVSTSIKKAIKTFESELKELSKLF